MKHLKKTMASLGGAICLAAASQSFAAIEVYDQQSAVNPVPSSSYPIVRTFATTTNGATLTYGSLNISCTLSLTGSVDEVSPGLGQVTVTGGNVSGSGLSLIPCLAVNLTGFPWPSEYVAEADLQPVTDPRGDVAIRFSNVGVNLCSPSSGLTADAIFNNNNDVLLDERSSFRFVNATLWDVPPATIGGTGGTASNCAFTGNLLAPVGGDIDVVRNP